MAATTKQVPRIDRLVSNLGFCRRRDANSWIRHHVRIDGSTVPPSQSLRVDPSRLTIQGVNATELMAPLTIAVHKPAGYICSHARRTAEERLVDDLLPVEWAKRRPKLGICGRLDKMASGLVIMSQDGQWAYAATGKGHEREYEVELEQPIDAAVVDKFAQGLMLRGEENPLLPMRLTVDSSNDRIGRIVITEGRYHQIRRSFGAVGNSVLKIRRIRVAGILLDSLEEGKHRVLTASEMDSVRDSKQ